MSERLYPMVARMLGSHANAEDAIQEIMIKLWEHRGQIKNHPNLPAFIFLTARNYCLDLIKRKNLQKINMMPKPNYWLQNLNMTPMNGRNLNTI